MRTWFRLFVLALAVLAPAPAMAQDVLTVNKIDTPSTTDLTIAPSSGTVHVGGHLLPTLTDTYDFGSPNKLWNQGYLAQLNAILFALQTQTIMGGYSTIGFNAGSFAAAVGSADTTINFGTAMTAGHFVLVRGHDTGGTITAEYFQVGAVTTGTTYNVTRNLSGLGAKNWAQGTPFLVLGTTGTGRIDILAFDGKPRIQFVEQGATYNAQTVRGIIGNLNGYYSYATDLNGIVFGDPTGARFMLEATNGFRIYGGDNDEKLSIDALGNATFDGRVTIGVGSNQLRNADCTVGTERWDIFTNTGLSTTVNGPWPIVAGGWGLGGVDNDCYIGVTGTPAAGTVSSIFGGGTGVSNLFPVAAGAYYEASVYVGNHRSGNTYAMVQFFNSALALISSPSGNVCTAAHAGGTALAGYCRSGLIAQAPVGAVYARPVWQTEHTAELDPFIFFVHGYFGEAKPGQEDLTEWSPAGVTVIDNGLIRTDAINARVIAADSITTSELAANAVIAENITAGTITADKMTVSTLDAISANLGSITAGSITGVTASFGGAVTLNGSGATFSSGTGDANKVKWDGGTFLTDVGGSLFINSGDVFMQVGGGGQVAIAGGPLSVGNNLSVSGDVTISSFPSGTGRFVCHVNGLLYDSGSTCDGSVPSPDALVTRVQSLEAEIAELRAALAELAALKSERR